MCCLNPILNGEDNLCKISKTMNQNKRKSAPPIGSVINYMQAMKDHMQHVIDAIRAIANELEELEHKVKTFANLLVTDFNAKYELVLK